MRHGRKSQDQRFDGYKLSAAATKSTEALIAAVEVAPASEQDRPQAKNLIDTQPEAAARKEDCAGATNTTSETARPPEWPSGSTFVA